MTTYHRSADVVVESPLWCGLGGVADNRRSAALCEIYRRLNPLEYERLAGIAAQDESGWTWLVPPPDIPFGLWTVTASSRVIIEGTPTGTWEHMLGRVIYLSPDLEYVPRDELLATLALVLAALALGRGAMEEVVRKLVESWGFPPPATTVAGAPVEVGVAH